MVGRWRLGERRDLSGITVERALTGNVTCCLFRIQTKAMALEWHLYAFANTSSIFPSSRYHLPPLSNTLTESAQFSSVNSPPSAIFLTLVILDLLPRRPSILSQRLPPHARHGDPHYPYQSMLLAASKASCRACYAPWWADAVLCVV